MAKRFVGGTGLLVKAAVTAYQGYQVFEGAKENVALIEDVVENGITPENLPQVLQAGLQTTVDIAMKRAAKRQQPLVMKKTKAAAPEVKAEPKNASGHGKSETATTKVEQRRDSKGRFLPKEGGEVSPGSIAEQDTWDAIKKKPGWTVTEGRVTVRDSTGQTRVYDGVAHSPSGRNIGLEVKSGTARKTADQRTFDERVNSGEDTAVGVGENKGLIIDRVVEIER